MDSCNGMVAGGGMVMSPLHQIMSVRIVFGGTCDDSKLERRGYTKTITIAVGHVHEPLAFSFLSVHKIGFSGDMWFCSARTT